MFQFLTNQFNHYRKLRTIEMGIVPKLEGIPPRKENPKTMNYTKMTSKRKILTLEELQGSFVFLALGTALAITFFVAEIITGKIKGRDAVHTI